MIIQMFRMQCGQYDQGTNSYLFLLHCLILNNSVWLVPIVLEEQKWMPNTEH